MANIKADENQQRLLREQIGELRADRNRCEVRRIISVATDWGAHPWAGKSNVRGMLSFSAQYFRHRA